MTGTHPPQPLPALELDQLDVILAADHFHNSVLDHVARPRHVRGILGVRQALVDVKARTYSKCNNTNGQTK